MNRERLLELAKSLRSMQHLDRARGIYDLCPEDFMEMVLGDGPENPTSTWGVVKVPVPLYFSMCDWMGFEPGCGTVCCIAGLASIKYSEPDDIGDDISAVAARALGLGSQEARALFVPYEGGIKDIKPERAAVACEKLVELHEQQKVPLWCSEIRNLIW